jgi:acyl carrier protein
MTHDLGAEAAFTAVAKAISLVCDVEVESLHPDSGVAELDIDSMDAAEIVVQVQAALGVEIDFKRVACDWSAMSLGGLAVELVRHAVPVS